MSAHKEAAKQRKRKSLKMALEKCMQRRDAMAAVPEAVGGGSEEMEMAPSQASGAHTIHTSGSAGTEPPFSYEQQQQKMHHELAQQIKAAMAVEQAQRAEAEAEAEAMNTTANTTHTTTTTNTTTGTSDGGSGSDAEASEVSLERTMEVDESAPEPQPGSELVVVEPKIEPLSDTEDEEEPDHLHMSEPEPEVYNRMPHTPTTSPPHIIPPNETPILTSTPKVNVEQ
ncbi:Hypothetical predicted protein [Drosophila guanche]|uniref:Uncharacterized protein n=4 Tax=obscura subgroup TaxID=32357 RepID=A0A3B0JIV5_DROGU|nr:Hypothetical predicted protein [Drosophila guanche]